MAVVSIRVLAMASAVVIIIVYLVVSSNLLSSFTTPNTVYIYDHNSYIPHNYNITNNHNNNNNNGTRVPRIDHLVFTPGDDDLTDTWGDDDGNLRYVSLQILIHT